MLIAVAALVIVGLLRVVQTSQATTAGFAVQALQQDKLEVETALRQLEADVGLLSSLERIEREALRLGLAPAVTRDGDGGSLGYRVASILTADLALAGAIDDADATAFALTVGAGEAAVRRLDATTLARRARLAR